MGVCVCVWGVWGELLQGKSIAEAPVTQETETD